MKKHRLLKKSKTANFPKIAKGLGWEKKKR
jgi:hypothetical protein